MASLWLRVGCGLILACSSLPATCLLTATAPPTKKPAAPAKPDKYAKAPASAPAAKKETSDSEDGQPASPPAKPSVTEAYPYLLAHGGAARVAGVLQNLSIPGVGQVVATSDTGLVFLLDRQALIKSLSQKISDHGDSAMAGLQGRLKGIADALSAHSKTRSEILGLPAGLREQILRRRR